jgi:hypothetical protein
MTNAKEKNERIIARNIEKKGYFLYHTATITAELWETVEKNIENLSAYCGYHPYGYGFYSSEIVSETATEVSVKWCTGSSCD